MMETKRNSLLPAMLFIAVAAQSEMGDAFKGIWPVTDGSVMKSLNGTWNLKVIEGFVGTDKTVPQADDTWSPIPVPGNWEAYGRCKPTYSFPDSVTGYYLRSLPSLLHAVRHVPEQAGRYYSQWKLNLIPEI